MDAPDPAGAPAPYDPFARGPHPVGVTTAALHDAARDRPLPAEIWYPATASAAGRDLAPDTRDAYSALPGLPPARQHAARDVDARPDAAPVVVFSHGFGGHRRQSTFFCTHLASHGYAVVAVDHTGTTAADLFASRRLGPELAASPANRPLDVRFLLDALARGDATSREATSRETASGEAPAGLAQALAASDLGRVAVAGHSFGGFTALAASAADARIAATVCLAPAGGGSPSRTELLQAHMDLDRERPQPTVVIAAERDSVLPLRGVRELYERIRAPKQLVVLRDADHFHFCDGARQVHEMFRMVGVAIPLANALPPADELCPSEHGYAVTRAIGLAHVDATLRGSAAARAFLHAPALAAAFAAREIAIDVEPPDA